MLSSLQSMAVEHPRGCPVRRASLASRQSRHKTSPQGSRRMDRRSFVVGSGASAAVLAGRPAWAQDVYPSRAITFVNPFPPGGAADVVGRPYAAVLEPQIKQPCVIEPKAGAPGQVRAQFAAS